MKRALASCKPTKMWIDGKCFEIKGLQKKAKKAPKESETADQSAIASSTKTSEDEIDTKSNDKYEIGTDEKGKLFTSFRLPLPYCIKLSRLPDLKLLEGSTKTSISIPNTKKQSSLIITGENEENIRAARNEIHLIISNIRDESRAMQFVSIPTLSEEILDNFEKFKGDILGGEKINGMEESIFQRARKLHLTIAVFALLDDNEKEEAVKALQDYKTTVLDSLIQKTGPLTIDVTGVSCMNDNLKKVDVLYAKAKIVDETEETSLQKIVNGISNHFYDRGLMKKYQDNVTLHMTLINTKYRKDLDSPKRRWVKRRSFDATTIVDKYKDFRFGTCQLNSIHLSLISSEGDDGFYKPISVINLE